MNFVFFFNSILLGVGLAMDAFCVSLANGLNEPKMKKRKMICVAGVFAVFQALMPLIGWLCVHTIAVYFKQFEKAIPFIALGLLSYIGGKMIYDSKNENDECSEKMKPVCIATLIVQGIATSIDALSVGFTIAEYNLFLALISCIIIAIVTFFICLIGIIIGRKYGTKFADKAGILGGIILIFIGLEIFITSFIK